MKNFGKVKKLRARSRFGRHLSKKHVIYSGSPDSEVVADYLERFDYRPEKREEIRRKYAQLLNRTF